MWSDIVSGRYSMRSKRGRSLRCWRWAAANAWRHATSAGAAATIRRTRRETRCSPRICPRQVQRRGRPAENIRDAAKKEQYWRAAAWMLERGYPQRYARRGPDVITVEQIAYLLAHLRRS